MLKAFGLSNRGRMFNACKSYQVLYNHMSGLDAKNPLPFSLQLKSASALGFSK